MQVVPDSVVPKNATTAAVATAHSAAQNAAAYSRVSGAFLVFGLGVATLTLSRYLRPSVSKSESASSRQPVTCIDNNDDESHRVSEELGEDGKKNVVFITPSTLRLSDVIPLVESDSCGAVSTFSGVTRNHHGGKSVLLLRYEAYHEMALRQLLGICGDARKQWDVHSIAVGHRTGVVGVREASVVIAVSSVHRAESLEAVRFIIDALKQIVTIWKEEHYGEPLTPGSAGSTDDDAEQQAVPPQWKKNSEFSQPTIESLGLL